MAANDVKREIESRGQTVDAAVLAGLRQLGLSRDEVTIQVIDEGSRGLLGIGSREAVVRLTPVQKLPPAPPSPPVAAPSSSAKPAAAEPPKAERKPAEPKPAPRPAPAKAKPAPVAARSADDEADEVDDEAMTDETLAAEREAAVAIISELLDKMHVKATVAATLSEPDDLSGQRVNIVEINGKDLSVLIGPRGETVDSLQFLTRLMVAHKLHRRANFVVDVEGYRQRRLVALQRLAERMGEKARQRQEPISLEPMPAYERRIIHMTLRDSPYVYTESVGEGRQRKVRIFPKK
jgi:spoIIIJ-associated protein